MGTVSPKSVQRPVQPLSSATVALKGGPRENFQKMKQNPAFLSEKRGVPGTQEPVRGTRLQPLSSAAMAELHITWLNRLR